MRPLTLIPSALLLLLGCMGPASADIIYQTGFESPSYSLGTLAGQNNWGNSSIPVVENTTVLSGSQAVEFDASLLPSGQNVIAQPLSYNSVNNSQALVRIQEAFFLSATGTTSVWDVMVVVGNNGFIGQLGVRNNNIGLGLANSGVGSVPVMRGQWNSLELDLNFQTQIQSAFMNGIFIGEGSFSNPTTSLGFVEFGVNQSPGTDQAFFDNLSITSSAVPEPSTLVIGLLGVALAGGYGLRRRRRTGA